MQDTVVETPDDVLWADEVLFIRETTKRFTNREMEETEGGDCGAWLKKLLV